MKKTYRVHNWSDYNRSLVERGSLNLWIDEEVVNQWFEPGFDFNSIGHRIYSDVCIQCALYVRMAYQLSFRASKGFIQSIFDRMGLSLKVPCYSTFCRRQSKLQLSLEKPLSVQNPMDIAIDSTGFKVYGEGEWKVRTHGYSCRRTWRKFHIAMDVNTHQIEAVLVTTNDCHDVETLDDLLEQLPENIQSIMADGAYESFENYEEIYSIGANPIIPPKKNAKIKQHGNSKSKPLKRDQIVRDIRKLGRSLWKELTGYHKRSLVETAMYRIKVMFGDKLKSRKFQTQTTELIAKSNMLNRMTGLGMPISKCIDN